MEEYEAAKEAFEGGAALAPDATFKTWIRKCDAELRGASLGATASCGFPRDVLTALAYAAHAWGAQLCQHAVSQPRDKEDAGQVWTR